MTGPRVDPDPLEQLKALRAQRSSAASDDPLEQLKATRAASQPNPAGDQALHAEFRSGRLARRMARENANDRDAAAAEPTYGERLATHILNTAQGIPGMERLEATAGELGSRLTAHPMDYDQSLATLRGNTSQIGAKTSLAEHLMGSLAVAPFLRGSVALQGAELGAADQAASADDESLGRRALGTAVGAGAGAAGGAALEHVAAPIARGAAGAVTRGLDRIAPQMGARVGSWLTRLTGMGSTTDEAQARAMLATALENGGVSPKAAAATVPMDRPTTMNELGSRQVPSLVRAARNVPTSTAGQTTDRFLTERAAGTGKRIEGALNTATGHKPTDTVLPTEQFIAKASADAKPLYQQAYAHGEIQDPETVAKIHELRKDDPVFERAWQRGQNIGRVEGTLPKGTPATPASQLVDASGRPLRAGAPAIPPNPTVRDVDLWKRGLDAEIESGFGSDKAISRTEARAYRGAVRDVLGRVDTEVPDFKAARQAFAGPSELADASEEGANHFSPATPTGALERNLAGMSKGERDAYTNNALNKLVERIRGAASNPNLPEAGRGTNIVQRIMGTEDASERLGMLFPDEVSFKTFLKKMEDEALYPKTNQFLRGQSTTAAQQAEGATSAREWLRRGAHAVRHPLRELGKAALDAYAGSERAPKLTPGQANAIGEQATATGARLRSILEQMDADVNARELGRRRLRRAMRGTAIGAVTGATGADQGSTWRDQVNSLRNEP